MDHDLAGWFQPAVDDLAFQIDDHHVFRAHGQVIHAGGFDGDIAELAVDDAQIPAGAGGQFGGDQFFPIRDNFFPFTL